MAVVLFPVQKLIEYSRYFNETHRTCYLAAVRYIIRVVSSKNTFHFAVNYICNDPLQIVFLQFAVSSLAGLTVSCFQTVFAENSTAPFQGACGESILKAIEDIFALATSS